MNKRLQNICIVCISYIYFLWRGSGKKTISPKKFVVMQPTGNLGDMVCVTPLLHAIKRNIPSGHITVIGSSGNRQLLEDSPDVDVYKVMPQSVWKLIGFASEGKFDAGIVVGIDSLHVGALFLGGVTTISCFELSTEYRHMEPKPYKLISRLVHTVKYFPGKYIPDQFLRLLIPLGIAETTAEKLLSFSPKSYKKVTSMLESVHIQKNEKFIAIAPGAGSDLKRWPATRFAEVAYHMMKRYAVKVVIIGGPHDQHAVQEMIADIDSSVQYWNPGPLPFDELKALLAHAHIVIGNDSGAIHVGEAVGALTLTIAGATDTTEHMKEDTRHRIVKGDALGARYQAYIVNEAEMNPELARVQMESVTVDMVANVTDELMTPSSPAIRVHKYL